MIRGSEIPLTPSLSPSDGERVVARPGEGRSRASDSAKVSVAVISPLLLGWFTWYSRRYLRRHFHSVRISRSGIMPKADGVPLVIYSNHASWWDPLVGLVLKAHCYPGRNLFAPMDAAALQRYG